MNKARLELQRCVAEEMKETGLSQNKISALIGIHRSYLSHLKNGVRKRPEMRVAKLIQDHYPTVKMNDWME